MPILTRATKSAFIEACRLGLLACLSACSPAGDAEEAPTEDVEERGGVAPPPLSVADEVEALRAEPLELAPSTEVGTLPGSASVDASGQAVYRIPLELAPGVDGMTPRLDINYDSDRGNGVLGVGFALSGQSSVRRCTETILYDGAWAPVRWTNDDATCLDGDRLVLEEGTYGEDGSQYRLAHDPTLRIVLHGELADHDSSFEVFHADGTITVYGTAAATLWRGPNKEQGTAYIWAIAEKRDRFSNRIQHLYSEQWFGPTGPGHLRLDEIRYAGAGAASNWRRVRLHHIGRTDVVERYFFGARQRVGSLLDSITIESLGELQHTYSFAYEMASGRNQLTAVKACDGAGACLPPTEIAWSPPHEVEWDNQQPISGSWWFLNSLAQEELQQLLLQSQHTMVLDLDGDLDHELMFRGGSDGTWPWYAWNEDESEESVYSLAAPVPPAMREHLDEQLAVALLAPPEPDLPEPWPAGIFAQWLPQYQPALSASVIDFAGDRRSDVLFPRRPVGGDLVLDEAGHPYADGLIVGLGHGLEDIEMLDLSDASPDHIYTVVPLDHDGDLRSDAWLCRGPGHKSGRWVLAHATATAFEYEETSVGCSVHDELLVVPTNGGGQRLFVVPAYDTNVDTMPVPSDFETIQDYVQDYEPTPDALRLVYRELRFDSATGESSLQPTTLPRDRYQRWHDGECRNGLADAFAGAPLLGAGMGHDKLLDVNTDGLVDVLRFELGVGDGLAQQAAIATGLPTSWDEEEGDWLDDHQCEDSIEDVEDGVIRVYWNTGEGFVAGSVVHEFKGQSHANYWANFVAAQPIDADDDGRMDLLLPASGPDTGWTLLTSQGNGSFSDAPAAIADGWPAYNDDDTWDDAVKRARASRILGFDSEAGQRPDLVFLGYVPPELDPDEEWLGALNVWALGWTGTPSGRVVAVSDGLGKTTSFGYDARDVSMVGTRIEPLVPLGVPLFVTTQLCEQTRSVPADDPTQQAIESCIRYEYDDALVDRWGRGLLGFGEIRSYSSAFGNRVTRYSREFDEEAGDYVFAGRPTDQFVWHAFDPARGARQMHAERTTWTYDANVTTLAGGSSTYVYASVERSRSYAGLASVCAQTDACADDIEDLYPYSDTRVSDERDSFGTLLSRTSATVLGETTTWDASQVVHDEADWLLGQVGRVDETSCSYLGDCSYLATTFSYDADTGAIAASTQAADDPVLALKTSVQRDDHGNVETTTETPLVGAARVSSTEWDDDGVHPLSHENAIGQTSYVVHDPASGLLLAEVDVAGTTMRYEYDGFHRRIWEARHSSPLGPHDGGTLATEYLAPDPSELESRVRVQTRQGGGQQWTTHFDATGSPILRTWWGMAPIDGELPQLIPVGDEVFQRFGYSQSGVLRAVSVPQWWGNDVPGWSVTERDPLGREMLVTAPDGHVQATIVHTHAAGVSGSTFVTTTDGDGHTSAVHYDAHGHPIESIDALGTATCFVPGAWGKTLEIRRDCGNTPGPGAETHRTYDALGNLATETDTTFATRTLSWNGFGELSSLEDGNGQTTWYQHDQLGRLISTFDPSGATTYAWDSTRAGHLTSTLTPGGVLDWLEYDDFGRTTQATKQIATLSGVDDYVFEYDWGLGDRLSQLNYPAVDGEPGFNLQFRHDDAGYLRGLVEAGDDTGIWIARRANARSQIELEGFDGDVATQREYDELRGWLESIVTARGVVMLQDLDYVWTPTGELDSRSDAIPTIDQSESFEYDELHRLKKATITRNGRDTKSATDYDRLGNFTSKNGVEYGYDIDGLLINAGSASVFHDLNGNIISLGTRSFTYDAADKTATATESGVTTTMTYDARQRRVLRAHPTEGHTVTIGGLYEREIKPNGATNAIVYRLPADGRIVTQKVRTPGWVTKTYSVHDDHLGSTNVVTASALDTTTLAYDAWGGAREPGNWTKTVTDTVASKVRTGFTGHPAKLDLGLIDMGGRMYSPAIGRFTSIDPIVADPLDAQSWNHYSYVGNQPLVFTDPSGFVRQCCNDMGLSYDRLDENGNIIRDIHVSASYSDEPSGTSDPGVIGWRPTGMEDHGLGPTTMPGGTNSTMRPTATGRWVRGPDRLIFQRDQEAYDAIVWDKVAAKRGNPFGNLLAFGKALDTAAEVTLEYGSYVSPVIAAVATGVRAGDAIAAGDEGELVAILAEGVASRIPLGKGIVAKTASGKRVGDFSKGQKAAAKAENAAENGGQMACTDCGRDLANVGSKKGVPTPPNQAHVHHDPPLSQGGGSNSKALVLCPGCHIKRHK